MTFLSSLADGRVLLAVYVQPRASRTSLIGLHDRDLKLALTAPPVDNAANKAVVLFFASFFKIGRQNVTLYKGQQSRRKLVAVSGMSEEEVRLRLVSELEQMGGKE